MRGLTVTAAASLLLVLVPRQGSAEGEPLVDPLFEPHAEAPPDAPLDTPFAPSHPQLGPARAQQYSFLLPAVESELLHLGLSTFSNLASRETFAQISFDSIKSHFDGRRPWFFDTDFFVTNQFGHPYQGALSFTAARSSGLGFWWSCLYPLLASFTWELFYEIDAPSYNDQITTTLGGIFLGEVLHRGAELILETGVGGKSVWRQLCAFLVDPMGAVNRYLFNDELRSPALETPPPFFAQVQLGVTVGSLLVDRATQRAIANAGMQFTAQGLVTYGNPGDPEFHYTAPFSHFDMSAGISFPDTTSSSLFIRGLLVGAQYGTARGGLRGVWGLFGQYDFVSTSFVRISSVGVGPGTTFQWQLSDLVFLQTSAVVGGVPYASGGSLGLNEELFRDYHVGPGVQAVLEARLIHREAGMIRIVGRGWYMWGVYVPPLGTESVTNLTASVFAKLYGSFAAGLDFTLAGRRSKFQDITFDRALSAGSIRFTLSYMTDDDFGAVEPVGPQRAD